MNIKPPHASTWFCLALTVVLTLNDAIHRNWSAVFSDVFAVLCLWMTITCFKTIKLQQKTIDTQSDVIRVQKETIEKLMNHISR